jgi:peroxiredoxin Q/BCP
VDDADTNKKFAESLEADYPILSDPEKKFATAYGVVTPERAFANRWTFYIGPDGKILEIDKRSTSRQRGGCGQDAGAAWRKKK